MVTITETFMLIPANPNRFDVTMDKPVIDPSTKLLGIMK